MAKAKTKMGRRTPAAATASSGQTVTVDTPSPAKPRVSPVQFFSQVRAEARKIVWPSRKETWITSVMVLIMLCLAAAFFFVVDSVLSIAFRYIVALGN